MIDRISNGTGLSTRQRRAADHCCPARSAARHRPIRTGPRSARLEHVRPTYALATSIDRAGAAVIGRLTGVRLDLGPKPLAAACLRAGNELGSQEPYLKRRPWTPPRHPISAWRSS